MIELEQHSALGKGRFLGFFKGVRGYVKLIVCHCFSVRHGSRQFIEIAFIKTYILRFEEISEPLACDIDFDMKVAA
jgi:hypothetical protein